MLKAYVWTKCRINDLRENQDGVTAMEYGLIAAVTVVTVGAALITGNIGANLSTIWSEIASTLAVAA